MYIWSTRTENDKLVRNLNELFYKDYAFIEWNITSDIGNIKMLSYIALYHTFFQNWWYLKVLNKRWKLKLFKNKEPENYNKIAEKILFLDKIVFIDFFWAGYEELLLSWKNKEIQKTINHFYKDQLTWKKFDNFVEHIWRKYELYLYMHFDAKLSEKIFNNKENEVNDMLLAQKMKIFFKRSWDERLIVI